MAIRRFGRRCTFMLCLPLLLTVPTLYVRLQLYGHLTQPTHVSDRHPAHGSITRGAGIRRASIESKTPAKGFLRRLPGAFILGVQKCGTGALRHFIARHPQIVMPAKEEMWFYDKDYHRGEPWHLQQMPLSSPDQVTLESSPGYFYHTDAMRRILRANRTARFVVIVRDPVQRAMSEYLHKHAERPKVKGVSYSEPSALDFKTWALKRDGTVNGNWQLLVRGLYALGLKRWLEHVPLEQFLIIDGAAFTEDPLSQLQNVERFLGVEKFFKESHFVYNGTKGFYCFREESGSTSCLPESKGRKHLPISKDVLSKLRLYFEPYNEALFKTLVERFDWW